MNIDLRSLSLQLNDIIFHMIIFYFSFFLSSKCFF